MAATDDILNWISFPSPVGTLTAYATDKALTVLEWGRAPEPNAAPNDILRTTREQLDAYFDGKLTVFDMPVQPDGSDFQKAVCRAMFDIPYGETCTYGDIATQLDSAARAVGMACGKNPIPIIIPCHRVMGAGGKLTGYSGRGGTETKNYLLRLEGLALI